MQHERGRWRAPGTTAAQVDRHTGNGDSFGRDWGCRGGSRGRPSLEKRPQIFGQRHRRQYSRALQTTEIETGSHEPRAIADNNGSRRNGYGLSISDLQQLAEAPAQELFSGPVSSAAELAELLRSSLETGICSSAAALEDRRQALGSNRLPEREQVR